MSAVITLFEKEEKYTRGVLMRLQICNMQLEVTPSINSKSTLSQWMNKKKDCSL